MCDVFLVCNALCLRIWGKMFIHKIYIPYSDKSMAIATTSKRLLPVPILLHFWTGIHSKLTVILFFNVRLINPRQPGKQYDSLRRGFYWLCFDNVAGLCLHGSRVCQGVLEVQHSEMGCGWNLVCGMCVCLSWTWAHQQQCVYALGCSASWAERRQGKTPQSPTARRKELFPFQTFSICQQFSLYAFFLAVVVGHLVLFSG